MPSQRSRLRIRPIGLRRRHDETNLRPGRRALVGYPCKTSQIAIACRLCQQRSQPRGNRRGDTKSMRRVLTTAAVIVVIAGLGASAGVMSAGAVSTRVVSSVLLPPRAPAEARRPAQATAATSPGSTKMRLIRLSWSASGRTRGRAVGRRAAQAGRARLVGVDRRGHRRGVVPASERRRDQLDSGRAAPYKFAFIKVSEGSYYTNPYYAADASGAEAQGCSSRRTRSPSRTTQAARSRPTTRWITRTTRRTDTRCR